MRWLDQHHDIGLIINEEDQLMLKPAAHCAPPAHLDLPARNREGLAGAPSGATTLLAARPEVVLDWCDTRSAVAGTWIPEDLYRAFLAAMPICCVDVVVVWQGQMLLTRRRQDPQAGQLWVQGGRLRKGEGLAEGALRRAAEETGLGLKLDGYLGTFGTNFGRSAHGNESTHTVNITFRARPSNPRVVLALDASHADYRWWPLDRPLANPYLQQLADILASDRGEE